MSTKADAGRALRRGRVRVVELEQSSFRIEDERVLVERRMRVAPSYRGRERCEQQEAAHGSLSLGLVISRRRGEA